MKITKTVLATSLVVACISSYAIGYKEGTQPRFTELQVSMNKANEEVKKQNRSLSRYTSLLALKNKQLETPVMLSTTPGIEFGKKVKVAKFTISAYSPYDDRNYLNSDGSPNDTATGTKPRPGTFAVDPNVIPYGSKVTIIYPDGTMEQGIAEDTGGAIKHNRIDVFRWTFDAAMQFGMKEAIVLWQ